MAQAQPVQTVGEATATAEAHPVSATSGGIVENGSISERSLPQPAEPLPATTVSEWAEQIAQSLVQITAVQLNPTEAGIEVVLQTTQGELIPPPTRIVGNALIADIPNAVLSEGEFSQANPIEGIALVSVTSLPGVGGASPTENRVRVAITGTDAPPTAEIRSEAQQLVLSVAIGTAAEGQEEDAIQVVVTGEQEEGYAPSEATTATRTNTPLRDIPQSIQVVPQQVIEDQGITRVSEATRNVSGTTIVSGYGNLFADVNIRGFSNNPLRDGFVSGEGGYTPPFINGANIERVEVLKGPASVLYGTLEPGGVVNYVTEQPLSDPYYAAELTAGSYAFYQGSIDLSGPLTADERLLYRLNASYENSESYRDFIDNDILFIAPVITYRISDSTNLTLAYEYLNAELGFDRGFRPESVFLELPRDRLLNEPDDFQYLENHRVTLTLNHQFNENLRLRSGFFYLYEEEEDGVTNPFPGLAADGRTLERTYFGYLNLADNFALQTDLIGEFNTGSIDHQLLSGLEWRRRSLFSDSIRGNAASIDIFDPVYDSSRVPTPGDFFAQKTDTIGIYLQDQVTLLPNLHLLVGGRYDFVWYDSRSIADVSIGSEDRSEFYDDAFSPRVGIVYQPIEPLSLYASYSRSFVPNNARTFSGDPLEPSRGTQYEVGIKAEFGDLFATLAAYEITKTNVATVDPDNIDFSIAAGEVTSRGIEFDIAGEILPGWNVIASAFLNDAFISEDNNSTLDGQQLVNAPETGASLWTTYELQSGDLQGLGFGAGVFYTGDRFANQEDLFNLPSFVRVDAALYYRRDNWRAALNFRNLFDTEYYASNGFLVFPQAPFTVQGTVEVRF